MGGEDICYLSFLILLIYSFFRMPVHLLEDLSYIELKPARSIESLMDLADLAVSKVDACGIKRFARLKNTLLIELEKFASAFLAHFRSSSFNKVCHVGGFFGADIRRIL